MNDNCTNRFINTASPNSFYRKATYIQECWKIKEPSLTPILIPPATNHYGALYNWYAITDTRTIAPPEFHVPTESELQILNTELGGYAIAGGKLKETGTTHWNSPNTGSTNEVNFTAVGGGMRGNGGSYSNINLFGFWFTSTEYDSFNFWCFSMTSFNTENFIGSNGKDAGFSLRFIADSGTPISVTGNDGKVYPCVTIGSQTWTAVNCNETKYRNGDWIHGFDGGVYIPIDNATWTALTSEAMCYYNDNPTIT